MLRLLIACDVNVRGGHLRRGRFLEKKSNLLKSPSCVSTIPPKEAKQRLNSRFDRFNKQMLFLVTAAD